MNVTQQNTDQLLEKLPKLFSEVRVGWRYSMPNSISSACEEICISPAPIILQKEQGLWNPTYIWIPDQVFRHMFPCTRVLLGLFEFCILCVSYTIGAQQCRGDKKMHIKHRVQECTWEPWFSFLHIHKYPHMKLNL